MATLTARPNGAWQATVRIVGYPTKTKTFPSKKEASTWAIFIEGQMHGGIFVDRKEAEQTTFADILRRYQTEIVPEKRGWDRETRCINQWLQHNLALRRLASLRTTDFNQYKLDRLKEVSGSTVRRELALFSNIFEVARKDWSIPVENPIKDLRKPKPGRARDRRLITDEEIRLFDAIRDPISRTDSLEFAVILAIETGMRAGEIASLTVDAVDLARNVVILDQTKNGESRIVPLTETAAAAIQNQLARLNGAEKLTTFCDSNGLGKAFRRACARAGIKDLHFHDLRHEAASRLAPKMEAPILAKVMGWKTLQMAMRYYNPTAEDLVSAVRA